MRIMITLLMVLSLWLTVNCSAEDTFTIKAQTEDSDRDFLELFPEEEQCIILAFEHQLDTFAIYYRVHHTGMVSTASSVGLWDVGSLYWNSEDKTLDGFLEYIIAPSREQLANVEINEKAFKEKVKKDYPFVKELRIRERKEEALQKEKNRFFLILYEIYQKLINTPEGKRCLKELGLNERED